jgi:hypothetical protein
MSLGPSLSLLETCSSRVDLLFTRRRGRNPAFPSKIMLLDIKLDGSPALPQSLKRAEFEDVKSYQRASRELIRVFQAEGPRRHSRANLAPNILFFSESRANSCVSEFLVLTRSTSRVGFSSGSSVVCVGRISGSGGQILCGLQSWAQFTEERPQDPLSHPCRDGVTSTGSPRPFLKLFAKGIRFCINVPGRWS